MSDRFDCHHCTESLLGKKFALKDDAAYCIPCYDGLFSNFCEECHKAIECSSKDLAYKGLHWHEGCFNCAKCGRSLVEKPFAAKDERLLCTECHASEHSSKCSQCGRTIMPGSRKMEFKGKFWHETCFVCQRCQKPIGTEPLISKENGNYCVPCFQKLFAHLCVSCKKEITTGGVNVRDQPWHRECFLCAGCKKPLSGQRFISKDERPYCVACFSNLFAEKCAACTQPITAFGGATFVSFEERQWHRNCFNCGKCGVSLVGQGFLTQRDGIFCRDCGLEA
ncbi:four and a half LIM domains protein 5 isoform X1 [Ornithorhynchus anatinus]|uniref:Four and a half LIM domains 5 n=1 Tax=Ornithorhynchus anatinus TaxID=9258 RepID=F7FWU9_ORNAN|nr:four and a half LIM domains protein 5 isoform X1 [Ornithorhynchus anatinus]